MEKYKEGKFKLNAEKCPLFEQSWISTYKRVLNSSTMSNNGHHGAHNTMCVPPNWPTTITKTGVDDSLLSFITIATKLALNVAPMDDLYF